jgi:RNA polymerase primary sigma factor
MRMAYPGFQTSQAEILRTLLDKADTQGYLTSEDIIDVYPQTGAAGDTQGKLLAHLRRLGVDVLEAEEDSLEPEPLSGFPCDEVETPVNYDQIAIEDTVEIYLKEMSRVPLLTVQEEINLAQRIMIGKQAQKERASLPPRSSAHKRRSLEELIEDGRQARDHIIKANTRLVVSIAKRYIGHGVPFLDLIQEGNLGLMKAVEKYEYRRGFRFSTYATWWIRQTITRAIADQARTIRVPVHMTDRIRKMYKIFHDLEQVLGRPPTHDELCTEMNLEPDKLQWMLQVSWIPLSLDSPVGDDEDSEFGMFVEDEITPIPAQVTYENLLREKMNEVLGTLSPREARVLRLRFGLDNGHPYTLEEVGQKFGLTRERIRQIEGRALRRLRHPCRARQLREYL